MTAVIITLLLISSTVTLTPSLFQKASAQLKSEPNPRLPGQEQQQTGTGILQPQEPTKSEPGRLPTIPDQEEQQQTGTGILQPQQPQGEEEEDKQNKGKGKDKVKIKHNDDVQVFVPIATSGNNVYVVWPSNKTTADFEIMFKASTDGGRTFGNKTNLSNTPNVDSINAEINAAGNNVYVSWWERNATSNEPVLKTSTDNGKTFSQILKLAANGTLGGGR